MSITLPPTTFSALSQSYTAPTLPSAASARAQAKSAIGSVLTGGAATGSSGATTGSTATTGAAQTKTTGATFHHMLNQALKKSAQGMARHTAAQIGVHPDQSSTPTNAQAATGHAVNVIA